MDKEEMRKAMKAYYDFEIGNTNAALIGIGLGIALSIAFIIIDITR